MRYIVLTVGVLTLASGVRADAPEARLADLQADPALGVTLPKKATSLREALAEINALTEKAFIVLGADEAAKPEGSFEGKRAGELLAAVAAKTGTRWRQYGDFYLLYPPDLERHDARPRDRTGTWKELKRLVRSPCSGTLMETVLKLGKDAKVPMLIVGPGVRPQASKRSFMSCVIAARERSLDEVMRALTVLTGDPWDFWQDTHLLCFTGAELDANQRRQVMQTIAAIKFTQSLTAGQMAQVNSERGLSFGDLGLRQRQDLAAATAGMRSRGGVPPEHLLIRNLPRAPGLPPSGMVEIWANTPQGARSIGSIRVP